jgi:hypothetical protein
MQRILLYYGAFAPIQRPFNLGRKVTISRAEHLEGLCTTSQDRELGSNDIDLATRREPLLRIRQVIYSNKGTVILYVLGLYRSDRHQLVIRRFR